MASPLCSTGLYANDVLCEVINNLDALNVVADGLRVDALAALDDLKATSESGVANLDAIDYEADTSSLSLTFNAPTYTPSEPDFSDGGPTAPTAPTLAAAPVLDSAPSIPDAYTVQTQAVATAPTIPEEFDIPPHSVGAVPVLPAAYVVPPADSMLIADEVFDDVFDRASARLARVGAKEERDAMYQAASMGLGLPSASLLVRLERAQHGINTKTSEAALEASIQEGTWKREDVKTLHGLHVQNWPLKPGLDVQLFGATEGASTAAYKALTDANLQGWNLRPQIALAGYQAEESLRLDAYKTETNASVTNWSNKPRLDVEAWQSKGQLESQMYQTAEGAKNANYSAQVQGFGTESQWALGYLQAETARYAARLDQLKVDITMEAERRGWSEMQLRDVLEQADKGTGYAISKAQAILATTQQAETAIAQLLAGLAQAVYSAANYDLGGRASQSVSETV